MDNPDSKDIDNTEVMGKLYEVLRVLRNASISYWSFQGSRRRSHCLFFPRGNEQVSFCTCTVENWRRSYFVWGPHTQQRWSKFSDHSFDMFYNVYVSPRKCPGHLLIFQGIGNTSAQTSSWHLILRSSLSRRLVSFVSKYISFPVTMYAGSSQPISSRGFS